MRREATSPVPARPVTPGPGHGRSIGDALLKTGRLTTGQLDLALREQRRRGESLTRVLMDLRLVTPEVITEYLGQQANTRSVSLKGFAIPTPLMGLVPEDLARQLRAVPFSRKDGVLTVALSDPLDLDAIDTLQHATGLSIEVLAATERDIIQCLEVNYRSTEHVGEAIDAALVEMDQQPAARPIEELLGRAADPLESAPIIRLVTQIINGAVRSGASDIHFEPEEHMMRIRKRIDGVLHPDVLIPKAMQSAVTTRMKILAELDVAESGIPQDGQANVLVAGRPICLRVSSLPTRFGENVVARILDPEATPPSLPGLGFEPGVLELFREAVNRPYGVVLVTGPTGSGKTTTLYAVLTEIATLEVSTFTLEDPIEYLIPQTRQTQIREERGLTFSSGLRALLRQDPDIILVGETRDTETAELMIRAALTGHLVLSTLHTNDAAGAIPRLIDMGVEPFLLPVSLIGVLAQRLVRLICPRCRQPVEKPAEVLHTLKLSLPDPPRALWRGAGCAHCSGSGYRARKAIFEWLGVDDRFHDPVLRRAPASEFVRLGRERGMLTMFEDGLLKAGRGLTSLEEVWRATRQP